MWFTTGYNMKSKNYCYKIIFIDEELKTFRKIVNENMDRIRYNDLNVKKFEIEKEYSINIDLLEEIKEYINYNNSRLFIIEIDPLQSFDLLKECLNLMIIFKQSNEILRKECEQILL